MNQNLISSALFAFTSFTSAIPHPVSTSNIAPLSLLSHGFSETSSVTRGNFSYISQPLSQSSSLLSATPTETLKKLHEYPALVKDSVLDFDPIAEATVTKAQTFVWQYFTLIVEAGFTWVTPHITSEGDGDISLEWWGADKVLTFFIPVDGPITSLKTWGPNIWEEMDEIETPSNSELVLLWSWLQS